jgi:hypothetical protein
MRRCIILICGDEGQVFRSRWSLVEPPRIPVSNSVTPLPEQDLTTTRLKLQTSYFRRIVFAIAVTVTTVRETVMVVKYMHECMLYRNHFH